MSVFCTGSVGYEGSHSIQNNIYALVWISLYLLGRTPVGSIGQPLFYLVSMGRHACSLVV